MFSGCLCAIELPDREAERERPEEVSEERMREQQRCRDYWARMYGPDAERVSRGGVSWLR